jgi:hypothetical protein
MNLFELAEEYKGIEAAISDMDFDEQTMSDTLEAARYPFEQKAVNVGLMIRNLEAGASAKKDAAAGILKRAASDENKAKWLRDYLLASMKAAERKKIDSPLIALSVAKNRASVVIDVEAAVPKQYWTQPAAPEPVISKTLIKDAIDAGQIVPGAHIQKGERVVIK